MAAGGAASMADMAAYQPLWTLPLSTAFDGMRDYAPDPGPIGDCWALEALNLFDHAPLKANYWVDADSFRRLASSLRFAQLDHYVPDVLAFEKQAGVGGSCAARDEAAYGAALASVFEKLLASDGSPAPKIGEHSAAVVVVDKWGNVAALNQSSSTALWGDTGLVVDGVPIPAPAPVYRVPMTRISAGSRIPDHMTAFIALRDSKPALALANVGVSGPQEAVRFIASLRTASPAQVAAAPPVFLNIEQSRDPILSRPEPIQPGRYPPELIASLGLPVRELDPGQVQGMKGTLAKIGARRCAQNPFQKP